MLKKFFDKYRSMSKPAKASVWFIISNIALKGISFITLPIFSRLLTPEQYGTISVYTSWMSIISILCTLTIWGGVFNVVMVRYTDKNERASVMSSFQGLAVTITLIFAAVSVPLLPVLSKLMGIPENLIFFMYIEILASIPFSIWSGEQRFDYEYKALIAITVITALANPLLGYFAVIGTEYKAEARIISGMAVPVLIGVILFVRIQIKGKNFFDLKLWKYGFCFNVVLIPHYLSCQVLNQADRVMINNICGAGDAGMYSIAYTFAMLLSIIANGINSSLTPHIYKCLKDGDEKKLSTQITAIVAFVAVLTIGLICVVPDVFTLLLPESYYPAVKAIPPVAAGAFFLFLYPLFGSVEFYYEENKYITAASCVGAAANILLNHIFINLFGYIAAAYTTLVCYIGFSVCHYYFSVKIMKKNGASVRIYNIYAIAGISAVLIIAALGLTALYDHTVIRWSVIAVIMITAAVMRKKIISVIKVLMNRS